MKKRTLFLATLVVALVGILGGIAGGLWYLYQNSGSKLLQKAQLAVRANRFDRALDLVGRYIVDYPKDWHGYYVRGQAYHLSARYDEARKALEEAANLAPAEASVPLLLAETYTLPARRALGSKEVAVLQGAVGGFQKADEVLSKAPSKDASGAVDLLQRVGMNQIELAEAQTTLAARLEDEALGAEARRDANTRDKRRSESKDALTKADEANRRAVKSLLDVVTRDASRGEAATALIQLCFRGQDQESLSAARKAIMGVQDPAPVAATMLLMEDLRSSASQEGPGPVNREKLATACGILDEIRKKHPDNVEVKLARADLAMQLSDLQTAKQLCDEVMKANPKHAMGRLRRAELLIRQGEAAEAERTLSALKADIPRWPDAQYWYSLVSLSMGKTEQAREALAAMARLGSGDLRGKLMQAGLALELSDLGAARQLSEDVLRTAPGNLSARLIHGKALARARELVGAENELGLLRTQSPRWPEAQLAYAQVADQLGRHDEALAAARIAAELDPANAQVRRFLATVEMQQGSNEKAFADANALYSSHPDDPVAILLFVEAAVRNQQVEPARKVLEKAAAGNPSRPEVLMAVSEGYSTINDRAKAIEVARIAAAGTPTTPDGRLAVVRALTLLDRIPEAEKMLNEALKKDPAQARVHYQLAQLCAGTGRLLPAIDRYRAAADLDKASVDYRVTLARALLDTGDLGECAKVLETVDSFYPAAELLRFQVKMLRGEQVDLNQTLQQASGGSRSALAIALTHLASGQLQKCVEFCEAELGRKPDDTDLRLLLGRAYVAMGQEDKGIQQWEQVLQKAPDRLSTYLELASVLTRGGDPSPVAQRMSRIPGAQQDLVNLSIGRALAASGYHDKAVETLARLAERPEAPEHVRGRAGLLLAQALAGAGQIDKAITQYDQLGRNPAWRKEALLGKAGIVAARRPEQSESTLAELKKIADEEKDTSLLRMIGEFYSRIGQSEKALAVCDQLQNLLPNDSRTFLLRAVALKAAGKVSDAVVAYRKAIELQPGNFVLYLALAEALDAQQQSVEALAALRQLEETGPAGASVALYQRGALLAGWGLDDQAAECFTKLTSLGHGGNPRVQLLLGRAFAALGQSDRAGEFLKQVPPFADAYVPARLILSRMAPTVDARLDALRKLYQTKPGSADVLLEEMTVLMEANQPADALKAYRSFADRYAKNDLVPPEASYLAALIMLEAGDKAGARDLALRVANQATRVRWRLLGVLLAMDDDPQSALKLLPEAPGADPFSAMSGLCLARRMNDAEATRKWLDRFAQVAEQTGKTDPSATAPYQVLVALTAGQLDKAKSALPAVTGILGLGRSAPAELVSSADATPRTAEEARVLLKASLALEMGFPGIARAFAEDLLKARPTCQWAAVLAFRTRPDAKAKRQVVDLLQPKDCALACMMAAELLRMDSDFAKAADLCASAARTDDSPDVLLAQGVNTEHAGKLPEALALYRKAWEKSKHPIAANNVAYVTVQLYPKDPARLTEAKDLIGKAIAQSPGNASFRDTLGWIAYLQGQYEEACTELRRAVKADPGSPLTHYHLGVAESACGRLDLARWHFGAVVNIGKALQARNRPVPSETVEKIELSLRALNALGPSK